MGNFSLQMERSLRKEAQQKRRCSRERGSIILIVERIWESSTTQMTQMPMPQSCTIVGTPSRLNEDDFCRRLAILSQSWEREALSPTQLLSRAIDHGLTCESKDPGQAA